MVLINSNKIKLFVGKQPTIFQPWVFVFGKSKETNNKDKHLFSWPLVPTLVFTYILVCDSSFFCAQQTSARCHPCMELWTVKKSLIVTLMGLAVLAPSIASTIQLVPTSFQTHHYKINKLRISINKLLTSIVHTLAPDDCYKI